jgi:hypothetical protein
VESYDRLEVLFWTIFDQKSGQLQKIISRKQKIWYLQNFNHGFLTYQLVTLFIFCPIIFVFTFKYYIVLRSSTPLATDEMLYIAVISYACAYYSLNL